MIPGQQMAAQMSFIPSGQPPKPPTAEILRPHKIVVQTMKKNALDSRAPLTSRHHLFMPWAHTCYKNHGTSAMMPTAKKKSVKRRPVARNRPLKSPLPRFGSPPPENLALNAPGSHKGMQSRYTNAIHEISAAPTNGTPLRESNVPGVASPFPFLSLRMYLYFPRPRAAGPFFPSHPSYSKSKSGKMISHDR